MGYPGAKSQPGVYHRLINLMPPHDVYIEAFLGGGSILRAKKPATVNVGLDLNRAALLSVANSAELVDYGDGGFAEPLAECGDRIQWRAPGGADYLLERRCAIDFLSSYRFFGTELVYCDPPYLTTTTRSGRQVFEAGMSDVDHRRLLRVCRQIKAMVMISGYRSTLYERELASWNSVSYQVMTRGGPAEEWCWFNFERPTALHDYRFLGSNFRERERIRRVQRRWDARLNRMRPLERQALLGLIESTWLTRRQA